MVTLTNNTDAEVKVLEQGDLTAADDSSLGASPEEHTFTVPTGKKWKLLLVDLAHSGGTFVSQFIKITTNSITINLQGYADSDEHQFLLANPITLNAGDVITVKYTFSSAPAALVSRILYREIKDE